MWLVIIIFILFFIWAWGRLCSYEAYMRGFCNGYRRGMEISEGIHKKLSKLKSKIMSDFDAKYRRSDDD